MSIRQKHAAEMPYLAAGFDPSGSRFAFAYQALDTNRLKVVSIAGDIPEVEISTAKGVQITALEWVNAPSKYRTQPKKRKKVNGGPSTEDQFVAIGTNQGTVQLYSPASNQFVASFGTAASPAVTGLGVQGVTLFVVQADGTISSWDLAKGSLLSEKKSALPGLRLVQPISRGLLVASTQPFLLSRDYSEPVIKFSGFASPVSELLVTQNHDGFAAIADDDRQVQFYSFEQPSAINSIMCPTNITHIAASDDKAALAAVSEDGSVYMFNAPFTASNSSGAEKPAKGRRRSSNAGTKASFVISLQRKDGTPIVPRQATFKDDFVTLVWAEQASGVGSERIQYKKNGEMVKTNVALTKEPVAKNLRDDLTNGHDQAAPSVYRESATTVDTGANFASIDVDDDADSNGDDFEGPTLADRLEALEVSGSSSEDEDDDEELANGTVKKSSRQSKNKVSVSAPGTFSVMLAQALKTDDKQLLEQCLAETDITLIRSSIIKLDPALAAKLLEKLAERMSRTQKRAGQLSEWAKWTMIVHGSYLVTVPNLVKALASLHTTLTARINTLPRLRALQGRLELLSSQIELRKEIQSARREIEDDNEDVPEYSYNEEMIVNGEEDLDADDNDDDQELDDVSEEDDDSELGGDSDSDMEELEEDD